MLMENRNSGGLDGAHAHPDEPEAARDDQDELVMTAATVGVVGAGVLLFEAALLPGLVLGVATMLVPKFLPKAGEVLNPLMKSTVRSAYKMGQKTKEMFAEVQEQVHDIVAEVDAETGKPVTAPPAPARPAA
jgi:hypothetical protein